MNSIAATARMGFVLVAVSVLVPLFAIGLIALYLWPGLERIAYSRPYRQLYFLRKPRTVWPGGIGHEKRSGRSPAPQSWQRALRS